MTAPALLLLYALLVSTMGSWALRKARWPARSPRLGIAMWLSLTASIVIAIALAGLALWLPAWPGAVGAAEFLHTCAMMLRLQYSTPAGAIVSTTGLGLTGLIAARLWWSFARVQWHVATERRRQLERLALVAEHDPATGVHVVAHGQPAAYCIPGRRAAVVVTSAALDSLDARQLSAVLAHERAHLRGRHDVLLGVAQSLQAAFPFVPVFRAAAGELARLIEMAADDAASGDGSRLILARALLDLGEAGAPDVALAAGRVAAVDRVRRLAGPRRNLGRFSRVSIAIGAAAMVFVPLVLATAPALAVAGLDYCPVMSRVA